MELYSLQSRDKPLSISTSIRFLHEPDRVYKCTIACHTTTTLTDLAEALSLRLNVNHGSLQITDGPELVPLHGSTEPLHDYIERDPSTGQHATTVCVSGGHEQGAGSPDVAHKAGNLLAQALLATPAGFAWDSDLLESMATFAEECMVSFAIVDRLRAARTATELATAMAGVSPWLQPFGVDWLYNLLALPAKLATDLDDSSMASSVMESPATSAANFTSNWEALASLHVPAAVLYINTNTASGAPGKLAAKWPAQLIQQVTAIKFLRAAILGLSSHGQAPAAPELASILQSCTIAMCHSMASEGKDGRDLVSLGVQELKELLRCASLVTPCNELAQHADILAMLHATLRVPMLTRSGADDDPAQLLWMPNSAPGAEHWNMAAMQALQHELKTALQQGPAVLASVLHALQHGLSLSAMQALPGWPATLQAVACSAAALLLSCPAEPASGDGTSVLYAALCVLQAAVAVSPAEQRAAIAPAVSRVIVRDCAPAALPDADGAPATARIHRSATRKVAVQLLSTLLSSSPAVAADLVEPLVDQALAEPLQSCSKDADSDEDGDPLAANHANSRFMSALGLSSSYMMLVDRAATSQARNSTGMAGLVNQGCTCYMNATMQQLFAVKPFRAGLLAWRQDEHNETDPAVPGLQRLFALLALTKRKAVDTRAWCNSFKDWDGNPVDVLVQRDAIEFFTQLTQKLEGALSGSPQEKLLDATFGGAMFQELTATAEDGRLRYSRREQPFLALTVPVQNHTELDSALREVIAAEEVEYRWDGTDGSDQSERLTTSRRVGMARAPPHLIVHLKRFEFDMQLCEQVKLNTRFAFPLGLDLWPYTFWGRGDPLPESAAVDQPPGTEPVPMAPPPAPAQTEFQYELTGVVVHVGVAQYGHYYSYVKDRRTGSWYLFNDADVSAWPGTPADFDADCFGGPDATGRERMANAFVLMYDRVGLCEELSASSPEPTAAGARPPAAPAGAEEVTSPAPAPPASTAFPALDEVCSGMHASDEVLAAARELAAVAQAKAEEQAKEAAVAAKAAEAVANARKLCALEDLPESLRAEIAEDHASFNEQEDHAPGAAELVLALQGTITVPGDLGTEAPAQCSPAECKWSNTVEELDTLGADVLLAGKLAVVALRRAIADQSNFTPALQALESVASTSYAGALWALDALLWYAGNSETQAQRYLPAFEGYWTLNAVKMLCATLLAFPVNCTEAPALVSLVVTAMRKLLQAEGCPGLQEGSDHWTELTQTEHVFAPPVLPPGYAGQTLLAAMYLVFVTPEKLSYGCPVLLQVLGGVFADGAIARCVASWVVPTMRIASMGAYHLGQNTAALQAGSEYARMARMDPDAVLDFPLETWISDALGEDWTGGRRFRQHADVCKVMAGWARMALPASAEAGASVASCTGGPSAPVMPALQLGELVSPLVLRCLCSGLSDHAAARTLGPLLQHLAWGSISNTELVVRAVKQQLVYSDVGELLTPMRTVAALLAVSDQLRQDRASAVATMLADWLDTQRMYWNPTVVALTRIVALVCRFPALGVAMREQHARWAPTLRWCKHHPSPPGQFVRTGLQRRNVALGYNHVGGPVTMHPVLIKALAAILAAPEGSTTGDLAGMLDEWWCSDTEEDEDSSLERHDAGELDGKWPGQPTSFWISKAVTVYRSSQTAHSGMNKRAGRVTAFEHGLFQVQPQNSVVLKCRLDPWNSALGLEEEDRLHVQPDISDSDDDEDGQSNGAAPPSAGAAHPPGAGGFSAAGPASFVDPFGYSGSMGTHQFR